MNMEDYKSDTSNFNIKFYGESRIQAEVLGNALLSLNEMALTTSIDFDPETKAEIYINKTDQASFEVDFSLIVFFLPNVVTIANTTLASNIVSLVANFLAIKLHLKGAPPRNKKSQSTETTLIENVEGDFLETSKQAARLFLNNNTFDRCTINIFNQLIGQPNRDYFELNHEGGRVVIPNTEFENMSQNVIAENWAIEEFTSDKLNVKVKVIKAVYEGDSQWRVKYRGRGVDASITDLAWIQKFQKSKVNIAPPGCKLVVDLKETIFLDSKRDEIKPPKIEITRVRAVELSEKDEEQIGF